MAQESTDIDAQIGEMQWLREAKRQTIASQELGQVLQEISRGEGISETQVEHLVAVLTRTIREPLEEKIALQQERIDFLTQQVDSLNRRLGARLWP